MKKSLLISTLVILLGISVSSQTRPRVFDNFDTSRGVSVLTPTVKPIVSSKKTSNRRSRRSGKTMNVNAGLGLKATSSSRLTMGSGQGMRGFTTGDPLVDSYIATSSRRYNIDPLLIYAQMHQESAFKKRARSHKGASGLMQLMPATARRFGVKNIYDPKQNIDAGVKYMRWLLNKFNGDVVLALAGYNAGEGAVMKYGNNVPPYRETRDYVRRISARYNKISNGNFRRYVKPASRNQVAKIQKEKTTPLAIYEPSIMTVKLSDGRMRLVSQ